MSTTYTWTETHAHAVNLFNGDSPGPAIESTILKHFQQQPAKVIDHIEAIGRRIKNGATITSGWAVLHHELERPVPQVTANDNSDRIKQLRIAEAWIRNAGGYIDRETELVSELYDPDIGHLRHWPDTKPQILALWHEQRHRFQKAEAESEARQKAQADLRHRLAAQVSRHSPVDIIEHADRIAAEVERVQAIPHPDADIPL